MNWSPGHIAGFSHRFHVLKRILLNAALLIFAFLLGHDFALTRLANDMFFGRTRIRDNGLIMQIRCRRFLYVRHCSK